MQRAWGARLKWGLSASVSAALAPDRFSALPLASLCAAASPPPPAASLAAARSWQDAHAADYQSWHRFVLELFCTGMSLTEATASGGEARRGGGLRSFLAASSAAVGTLFGGGVPGLSRPLDASPGGLDAQLLSPQLRAAIGSGGGGGSGGLRVRVLGARVVDAHLLAVDSSGAGAAAALEARRMQRLVLPLGRTLLVTALPAHFPFWWLLLAWKRVFSFVNHGLPGLLCLSRVDGQVTVAYLCEEVGGEGEAGAAGAVTARPAVHTVTWEGTLLSRAPLSWAEKPLTSLLFAQPASGAGVVPAGLASLGVAAGWQAVDVDGALAAAGGGDVPSPLARWLEMNLPPVVAAAQAREEEALRVLAPGDGPRTRATRLLGAARALRAALESDAEGRALLAGAPAPPPGAGGGATEGRAGRRRRRATPLTAAPTPAAAPCDAAAAAAPPPPPQPDAPVPGTLGERLADIEGLLSAAGELSDSARRAPAPAPSPPSPPFPAAELKRVALDVGSARPPLRSFRSFSFWGLSLMWYALRSPLRALLGPAPSRAADAQLLRALSAQALADIARTLLGALVGAEERVAPLLEELRLEDEALAFNVLVHRLVYEGFREEAGSEGERFAEEANARFCASLEAVAELLRSSRDGKDP
jgi:hypothetical protein